MSTTTHILLCFKDNIGSKPNHCVTGMVLWYQPQCSVADHVTWRHRRSWWILFLAQNLVSCCTVVSWKANLQMEFNIWGRVLKMTDCFFLVLVTDGLPCAVYKAACLLACSPPHCGHYSSVFSEPLCTWDDSGGAVNNITFHTVGELKAKVQVCFQRMSVCFPSWTPPRMWALCCPVREWN